LTPADSQSGDCFRSASASASVVVINPFAEYSSKKHASKHDAAGNMKPVSSGNKRPGARVLAPY
jgi:hypothetical protein